MTTTLPRYNGFFPDPRQLRAELEARSAEGRREAIASRFDRLRPQPAPPPPQPWSPLRGLVASARHASDPDFDQFPSEHAPGSTRRMPTSCMLTLVAASGGSEAERRPHPTSPATTRTLSQPLVDALAALVSAGNDTDFLLAVHGTVDAWLAPVAQQSDEAIGPALAAALHGLRMNVQRDPGPAWLAPVTRAATRVGALVAEEVAP